MSLDRTAIVKLTAALFAGEHDASVGDQMATEARNMIEATMTQMTLVRPRVAHMHAANVLLQVGLLGKAARALGALMALYSRMGVHVTLEHFALGEGQFALAALEGFQARVDNHVAFERAGARQLQCAAGTLERAALSTFQSLNVGVVVARQKFLRRKCHRAQMALERLHRVRNSTGFWLRTTGLLLEHQLTRSLSFEGRLLISIVLFFFLQIIRSKLNSSSI